MKGQKEYQTYIGQDGIYPWNGYLLPAHLKKDKIFCNNYKIRTRLHCRKDRQYTELKKDRKDTEPKNDRYE